MTGENFQRNTQVKMTSTTVYTRHSFSSTRPAGSFEKNQVAYDGFESAAVIVEAGLQSEIGLIIRLLFYAAFTHELTIQRYP